ncbi:MAG TPA: glycosyltransferase family 2 protein [Candidatus Binataceae bacterium]|nr:glycosyltransferase family 2 protein [Candidatus Binataceae bacterium]
MTYAVTVVIPTYNRRVMVREAVESVLAQRGASFELIVIDDGSGDGTYEDLSCLASERSGVAGAAIRIERTKNRGPAAARNLGAALARAPLLAFLDSDDLWHPDKLARQIEFMRANPAVAISQCQEIWIRNGRRVNPGRRHLKRAGDIFIESLRTCLVSPSAAIVRTDLFRAAGGFDATMAAAEDYDLWLRLLVDREIGLQDEFLVTRRAGHSDQLSAATPALDRFRILALAKLLASPVLCFDRRDAAAGVLAEKCRIYAKGLKRRGRRDEAGFFDRVAARALSAWRAHAEESLLSAIASICKIVSGEQTDGEGFDVSMAGQGPFAPPN